MGLSNINIRDFLKKGLQGIIIATVPLIYCCKDKPVESELSSKVKDCKPESNSEPIKEDKSDLNTSLLCVDGIEYYIQTDEKGYRSGDKVNFLYKVTNKRSEELNLGSNPVIGVNLLVNELTLFVKEPLDLGYSEVSSNSWDKESGVPLKLQPDESIEVTGFYKLPRSIYKLSGVFKRNNFIHDIERIVSVEILMFAKSSYR